MVYYLYYSNFNKYLRVSFVSHFTKYNFTKDKSLATDKALQTVFKNLMAKNVQKRIFIVAIVLVLLS